MRRRLLFTFAALVVGTLLVVLTVPFWMGGVAGRVGQSRGLTFGAYERIGYTRFALRDAAYARGNVRVTASRAEADTPVLWLWRHWRKRDNIVTVANWRVEVQRSTTPPNPSAQRGWLPLRAQLQRIATQLDRWLPSATAGAGVVQFPGGEIGLTSAKWLRRELAVTGLNYRALKADASVSFPAGEDHVRLIARTTDAAVAPMTLRFDSPGAEVTGAFTIWEQPASLQATFAPGGWLPREARVQATEWRVPGENLKLGQAYASVRGSARLEWQDGRILADINAQSEPAPGKAAPPLNVLVKGNGDLAAFTIESLAVELPGIVSRLSEPVTVERSGRIRESAAVFTVEADLAKQPWFAATGQVKGNARLVSVVSASPQVEFSASARDVTAREIDLTAVDAEGRLDWPRVHITTGSITGGEGEKLSVQGGWDIRAKEFLASTVEGTIRRASVARWLPKQPYFDVVTLNAQAVGPLATLRHEGRIEAKGLQLEHVNPMNLTGDWRGNAGTVEHIGLELVAGASKIKAVGRATTESAQITLLEFSQGETGLLRLAEPATFRWRPQLQIESFTLVGAEGVSFKASATAGETGRIELSGGNISSRWFSDFATTPGPAWQLTLLALVGRWDNGPMTFSLTAGAALEIGEGRTAEVMMAARGDQNGVHVEALRATEGDETVVNAAGRVPVTFRPSASPFLQIDVDGPLLVEAAVAPNSAFWQKLAAVTGVEFQAPKASAHLTGTWKRPEGNASLRAARITVDPNRVKRELPTIEALEVELTGDREGVNLSKFAVSIEGQALRAEGRLPIPQGDWAGVFKQPVASARRGADLRLEIPGAEVAAFSRFLPVVLAPKGQFQADLQYKDGGFEGSVKLRDAASRPLGPLGVVQEINADIALSGRTLVLRGVTARSGGQPVTLSGTVEVPETGETRFDLALKGENLPFVRQTGLLLRGDLDLKLQTPANAPPRLSGSVRLRDSLFLTDVRAFLPKGGGTSPSRRPPYFAIESAPVNTWTLGIDVTGDQFLRLRTPVFTGNASARFRLSGTLGEPRAIGEIDIDDGNIRMPFANFEVTQATVRLTEADPYEPEVYLRATGRRYGYDLTMEIEGNASQPNVTFTSSPALDSEQLLLMVMTGAAPNKEITNSATQRFANIGYFLGQSLLGSLGSDAADADRLIIASGEKISRQGKETYDIEYKLSDRWTVTGERNEFDEYNAGVKWRVFGGRRPIEEKEHAKK